MKKIFLLVLVTAFVSLTYSGCRTVVHTKSSRENSPGQMKKETGSRSAKPYAPGQIKKETGSKSAKPYAPGQQKKKSKKE